MSQNRKLRRKTIANRFKTHESHNTRVAGYNLDTVPPGNMHMATLQVWVKIGSRDY